MATTEYQCTICKRVRDIVDNDRGLIITTKCTITQGCRGTLIKSRRLPNTSRELKPSVQDDLVDWQQRNILWNHTQTISSTKWRIAHPINVPFIVDVSIIVDGAKQELKQTDFVLEYTEQNLATVSFSQSVRGTAQLIARNGSKRKVYEAIAEDDIVQISFDGRLIILDSTSTSDAGTSTFELEIIAPDGTVYEGDQMITIDGLNRTPWMTPGVIFNDSVTMKVFNVTIGGLFIVPAIGTIPDGSRLNITGIFGRKLKRHEILIGISYSTTRTDPFNRDKSRVVDLAVLKNGIIVRKGEAFVYKSDIENISPPLRIII